MTTLYDNVNDIFSTYAPATMIALSLLRMIVDWSPFTYIHLPFITFHAMSLIAMCLAYMIACYRLEYLPIPVRFMISALLVVVSIHFYDVFWGLFSYSNGGGFPAIPIMSFLFSFGFTIWLNRKHDFLDQNSIYGGFLFGVMVLSLLCMRGTGFFQAMNLYDLGQGPDPNMGSYLWVLSKLSGLLVFSFFTATGFENKEINWVIV